MTFDEWCERKNLDQSVIDVARDAWIEGSFQNSNGDLPQYLWPASDWAIKTIKALQSALEPLARLEIPRNHQGNAGAYSIRHKDIEAAKEILAEVMK